MTIAKADEVYTLVSPSGKPVAPADSWVHDLDLRKMVSIQGHWFEIVAAGPKGLVLEWRYPVGKKRKEKKPCPSTPSGA